jgi:hypothetical protein
VSLSLRSLGASPLKSSCDSFPLLLLAVAFPSCTTTQSPPQLALSISPAFSGQTEQRTFRRGAPLTDKDSMFGLCFRTTGTAADAVIYGRWTDPSFTSYPARDTYYGSAKHRNWLLRFSEVHLQRFFARSKPRTAMRRPGFTLNASARIYPRFRHKHFSWGQAVSFLVQYQNDNTNYVPTTHDALRGSWRHDRPALLCSCPVWHHSPNAHGVWPRS